MEQPTRDIELATDHDQLPAVDDVKIDAGVDQPKRRTWNVKQAFWIAFGVGLIVVALFVVTITMAGNDNGPSLETVPIENNPVDPAMNQVVEILSGVSDHETLLSPGTPQHRAASWLALEDPLAMSFLDNGRLDELEQRYILAVLFYSLGGEDWENDYGFLASKDVCEWFTVTKKVIDRSMFTGVWCNSAGKVQDLRFPGGQVVGSIPVELQHLKDLEVIDFGSNPGIHGEFPPLVKSLPKLVYLGLQYCGLKGTLPEWIGTMTSLKTLVLSNNLFTGTLPSSIGLMTGMEYLYLDDNSLEGDISAFKALTSLKHLVVEDNKLHGTLDESTVRSWANVQTLDISHNHIGSTLPSNLWSDMKYLEILDIHGNSFTGSLPAVEATGDHMRLAFLAVNDNHFEGDIPPSLTQFTSLKHLDLSNNRFDSTLPAEFESLENLRYFFAAHNPLEEGEIPTFLKAMTNLVDLSLQATNRIGSIPDWIGTASSLKLLDLGSNSLTGSIPNSMEEMTDLQHLLLNRNNLQGTIPQMLSQLTTLVLDQNELLDSAEEFCSSRKTPGVFTTDCFIECPCCTDCCEGNSCNNDVWNGDIDGIWEYGYRRGSEEYMFDKDP